MNKLKKFRLPMAITTFALCLIWLILYLLKPAVPSSIKRETTFTIFLPAGSQAVKLNASSIKYDATSHGLSYQLSLKDKTVLISEQATPDTFADGPVYAYLLQKSQQYATLNTALGQVALTHPKELNGGQLAITNPPGTLMFGRPSQNLTSSDWQTIFNAMQRAR